MIGAQEYHVMETIRMMRRHRRSIPVATWGKNPMDRGKPSNCFAPIAGRDASARAPALVRPVVW
jgi:hypothetical protein